MDAADAPHGARGPAPVDDADDGVLTASEVARLNFQADWMNLSACNTASADGKTGAESLSGLTRAFLYAGARALLVSHWPVKDAVAPVLTVAAIQAQQRDPSLSRAQALQVAIQAVRNGRNGDGTPAVQADLSWSHPAAWAPFVVVEAGE
jgi:CHAT domain-containing protein